MTAELENCTAEYLFKVILSSNLRFCPKKRKYEKVPLEASFLEKQTLT